jgi:hypothetical protein
MVLGLTPLSTPLHSLAPPLGSLKLLDFSALYTVQQVHCLVKGHTTGMKQRQNSNPCLLSPNPGKTLRTKQQKQKITFRNTQWKFRLTNKYRVTKDPSYPIRLGHANCPSIVINTACCISKRVPLGMHISRVAIYMFLEHDENLTHKLSPEYSQKTIITNAESVSMRVRTAYN